MKIDKKSASALFIILIIVLSCVACFMLMVI